MSTTTSRSPPGGIASASTASLVRRLRSSRARGPATLMALRDAVMLAMCTLSRRSSAQLTQPRLGAVAAARSKADVVRAVAELADQAVVEQVARLVQEQRVPAAPWLEVVDAAGVDVLQKRRRVRAGDAKPPALADVQGLEGGVLDGGAEAS